jgi:DNA polymerase-3 subunit delta
MEPSLTVGALFTVCKIQVMAEKKFISRQSPERVFVIAGKERTLVNIECERLLERLIDKEQRTMGLFSADAEKISGGEVLDELQSLPFLTEKKVVLLKSADDFVRKKRSLLENYFDKPCPSSILILCVQTWQRNTKLAKKLPGIGRLISITQPKGRQLYPRLIKYADEAYGKKLGLNAAELIVQLTGEDVGRLYSEIDKLALYANGEKTISLGHVEALTGHNQMFNIFSVIGSVNSGNTAEAISRLRVMFEADRSSEYRFVAGFAFHFRRMFNARVLLDKGLNSNEIAQKLNIWGDRESFFRQLRKMPLKRLAAAMMQLAETDYAIKTGRTKPQVAAEKIIFSMAATAGK